MSGQITSASSARQELRNERGQFVAGVLSSPCPIKPGQRISPATEFKPGMVSMTKLPIGSVRVRTRKRKGDQPRSWIKVGDPNKWILLAHHVWIASNGAIPGGHEIHHRNRNALDDRLENLQLVTPQEHSKIHFLDRLASRVGLTRSLKDVECSQCHTVYKAKKKRGLCPVCALESERASKRRYKIRQNGV